MNNSYSQNYSDLWKLLDSSIDANLQFAQYVIIQEPNNTKFFFGDYSYDIVKWIAISIYSVNAKEADNVIYQLYGDYFEFVTNPIDDFNKPQWYQLKSYKGLNDMKLKSWLMKNAHQFFARKKQKDDKKKISEGEILDIVDYEALLGLGDSQESLTDCECIYRDRLAKAWSALSEKDKNVLHFLVIEKLYWEDAFDELNEYINPRDGRQVISSWSDKRKQDALAMMKAQAVKHLIKKFNSLKV